MRYGIRFAYQRTILEYRRVFPATFFSMRVNYTGSPVPGRRKCFAHLEVRPAFSKFSSILNYTVY